MTINQNDGKVLLSLDVVLLLLIICLFCLLIYFVFCWLVCSLHMFVCYVALHYWKAIKDPRDNHPTWKTPFDWIKQGSEQASNQLIVHAQQTNTQVLNKPSPPSTSHHLYSILIPIGGGEQQTTTTTNNVMSTCRAEKMAINETTVVVIFLLPQWRERCRERERETNNNSKHKCLYIFNQCCTSNKS